MKINKETLYIIAFALFCFISLSGGSIIIELSDIVKIILYLIIIICFVLKILLDKISIKTILIYLCIGIVCIYTYLMTGAIFFLINFLTIIASKNVNVRKIVITDLVVKCIFIITHFVFYGMEYIFNYDNIADLIISDDGYRIRNRLFFVHPNIAAGIVLWAIIDYFYLIKKLKVKHILGTICIMLLTYLLTGSRTAVLIFVLFIILYCINEFLKNKKIRKILNVFQRYSIELITLISILLAWLYQFGNSIIYRINDLTSGRIYYSYKGISDFGINLFGNAKAINIDNMYPIDNFYIRCVVLYGIIFLIMLIIFEKLIDKNENKYFMEKMLFIVLAISLFSEYYVFIIGNSIALSLFGKIVIEQNQENNSIKKKRDGKNVDTR